MQEGAPMVSMNLSSRECDGRAVVALRGELDVVDAASVAAALTAVAVRPPGMIVDLAGLEVIYSRGPAALVLAPEQAKESRGGPLLSAPPDQGLGGPSVPPPARAFSLPARVV